MAPRPGKCFFVFLVCNACAWAIDAGRLYPPLAADCDSLLGVGAVTSASA